MQQNRSPVLGDVFGPAEVLTVQARLRLMELLTLPGQALTILPRQLAAAALPADDETLAVIRGVVEAGIDEAALVRLAASRLDVVVPALTTADLEALVARVPPRIRGPLAQHTDQSSVAEFTIEEISGWSGFGPKRVAQLIGVAVAVAMKAANRPDERLTFCHQALLAAGDDRDRGLFENDVLPLGPAATRVELAVALGISVDRVRRLAARASQRVIAALDQAPPTIGQLAITLAERLGVVAPLDAVDRTLAELRLPALPDTRSRLLLYLAGPYRENESHPGWVALDGSEVATETCRLIHEDGGVRPLDHLIAELGRAGVIPEHSDGWLARQPIRVSHGLVVATTGPPGDVAERALNAQGQSMSADELAAWFPDGGRGIQALWMARDRRFLLTADDRLALVEWGEVNHASA